MKRYNITADGHHRDATRRIEITEADNGEWVRYEDVTDTQLFIEMTAELDRTKLKLDEFRSHLNKKYKTWSERQ